MNQYIDLLDKLTGNNKKLFYRGHSRTSYALKPSLYREKTWYKNEKEMYQELQIYCPDDFVKLHKHIEVLAEMQHYGLPTRLLDVTLNPLIALYFACEKHEKYAGEIVIFAEERNNVKYPQSDTVAILASLPAFTFEQQKRLYEASRNTSKGIDDFNNQVEQLVHEVKMERPGFKNIIKQKEKIVKQLSILGINKARVYPEIDDVADFIKTYYKNNK